MSPIDLLASDFLAQKRIAVAGVTRTREDAANLIYRSLRKGGYQVFALNPNAREFSGDPCYPDLKSLPDAVDGVIIVTRPENTLKIVSECIELKIPRVWMHGSLGTSANFARGLSAKMTSVSPEAVKLCRENGIAVIPGACPLQFRGDFGHTCMRWTLRLLGALNDPDFA